MRYEYKVDVGKGFDEGAAAIQVLLAVIRRGRNVVFQVNGKDMVDFSPDGSVALLGNSFKESGLRVRYNSFEKI